MWNKEHALLFAFLEKCTSAMSEGHREQLGLAGFMQSESTAINLGKERIFGPSIKECRCLKAFSCETIDTLSCL
jgi:hypothetical protein